MATYRDYIPRKDADFDHWAKNFVDMVVKLTSGLIPVWTHIPTLRVTDLISAYHDWHAAYEATLVPHTPAVTMKKNEERAKTEHIYRTFKDHYLDFDEVTDAQRRDLGLHLRDTHYSPFGKPKTVPLIVKLEAIGGCRFRLYFKDEKSERSRAIPPGCNGCLLKYLLSEEPIEDKELLTETALITASPSVVQLPLSATRQWLSIAGQWQLKKQGILGNLGPIEHLIVT